MAADIFTKPFADGKAATWKSNLALINIYSSEEACNINFYPDMVRSMRGDLDKDKKAVPIDEANLGPEDVILGVPATTKEDKSESDKESTACPSGDDRSLDDYDLNGEWDAWSDADWTKDFAMCESTTSEADAFGEARVAFEGEGAKLALRGAAASIGDQARTLPHAMIASKRKPKSDKGIH